MRQRWLYQIYRAESDSKNRGPFQELIKLDISISKICGIVVTFNPDCNITNLAIERLRHQVSQVIIVDNASKVTDWLSALEVDFPDIRVLRNGHNAGLAAGLNQGITYALSEFKPEWIFILDQDSILEGDAISVLQGYLNDLNPESDIGILHLGYKQPYSNPSKRLVTKDFVINSGSLVRSEIYKRLNYREDFFVDSIDFDFCFAVRNLGYLILEIDEPLMSTRFGLVEGIRKAYPSKRVSSVTRNMTILLFEKKVSPLTWALQITDLLKAGVVLEGMKSSITALVLGLAKSFLWRIREEHREQNSSSSKHTSE